LELLEASERLFSLCIRNYGKRKGLSNTRDQSETFLILRQNKKSLLIQFLFGLQDDKIGSTPNTDRIKGLEEKIQILENLVASLQERVIHLENQNLENQRNLNILSEASQSPLKTAEPSKEDNIPLNQTRSNFITLGKISEQEKIEIRVNEVNRISTSSRRQDISKKVF
jgi:hypothetical protein